MSEIVFLIWFLVKIQLVCVASASVWFRSKEIPILAEREMKLAPFFAQSLTLVPRSFLLNRTETLATQAKIQLTS